MHRVLLAGAALAMAIASVACGGDNPSGASGAVVLRGTVVGQGSASDHATASAERAGAKKITVTVQEDPSLSTTVSGNGTFELSGLPEGGFTLIFRADDLTLGTIVISGFDAADEIRITVQVTTTTVVLIEIENGDGDDEGEDDDEGDDDDDGDGERTCAISGGKVGSRIELEGTAQAVNGSGFELRVNGNRVKNGAKVKVTTSGGTSFKCNGKPSSAECKAEDGSKVHVRGNLNTCSMQEATVAADEVKVQK